MNQSRVIHENHSEKYSESMNIQTELLENLLKPETQESLIVILENLPKIIEYIDFINKSVEKTQTVLSDEVLMDDLSSGVEQIVKPIKEKIKDYASTIIETRDKINIDQQATINLFGLIRMLKDPQLQKILSIIQTYLNVVSEKRRKE